jgi:acyl carrier protein
MTDDAAPTRDEVLALIRAHLAARDTAPEDVTEDASFTRDLAIDSLDLQTLARELEDEYGLTIGEEDAIKLQTVGQTVDFVVEGAVAGASR